MPTPHYAVCRLVRALSHDHVPVVDGQVLVRTDTGAVELDIGSRRVQSASILGVDALPEAPEDKIYLWNRCFWAYSETGWLRLGNQRSAGLLDAPDAVCVVSRTKGDFLSLALSADTLVVPPADLGPPGDLVELEVTGTLSHTFTLGGETFGGPNTSPRTDAWVITFHAGGDQVLRWRVLPCRPFLDYPY
jgi:hypothetical protein